MDCKLLRMVSIIFHHSLFLIILTDIGLVSAHSGFVRDFRPFSHHDPTLTGKHDTSDIVIAIQYVITVIFQKMRSHNVKRVHGIPQKFRSLYNVKNRAEPALVGPAKPLLIVLFFSNQLYVGGIAAAIQRHDRNSETDSVFAFRKKSFPIKMSSC